LKRCALLGGLLALALSARVTHAQDVEDPLAQHVAALLPALEARAAGAVARIDGTGRQLLAMRSYLRAGTGLAGRWSWSDAEIAAWQGSSAQAELDAAIARVRGAFESANAGYSLHVNPAVRSLEIQLERWNTNPSIAAAAAALADAAAAMVRSNGFPAPGTTPAQAALDKFLRAFVPSPTPPLAAPGLSPHGQMRAVDFVVMQDGRIVAGAATADIPAMWIGQGWAERLRAAVVASGAPFQGPLHNPDEPWHFDYRP
jgi:hypothetical protein